MLSVDCSPARIARPAPRRQFRALSVAGLRATLYVFAFAALAWTCLQQAPPSMDAQAYLQRGVSQFQASLYAEGLADLERAARMAPRNLQVQQTLAAALVHLGDTEKALRILRKSWSREPSRRTLHLMGAAYQKMELYEAAIGLYNDSKALATRGRTWASEDRTAARLLADTRIAVCTLRLHRPQEAIQILERVLASPAGVRAVGLGAEPAFWLGVARWDSGDRLRGLEAFQRALATDPTDMGSMYNIACYHATAGSPLTALSYLRQAVEAGFFEPEYFDHDPDLDSIRRLPEFQTLAQTVRQRAAAMPLAGPRSKDSVKALMADLERQRSRAKASRLLDGRPRVTCSVVEAPIRSTVSCSIR